MPGAVPVPQCMAGRCCWEHQGCGVPWASGTKGQDLSMAGVRVETALKEVPTYPEGTSSGVVLLV